MGHGERRNGVATTCAHLFLEKDFSTWVMTTHFVVQEGGETITKNRETGRSTKQSTATPKDKRCCSVCVYFVPADPNSREMKNPQTESKTRED